MTEVVRGVEKTRRGLKMKKFYIGLIALLSFSIIIPNNMHTNAEEAPQSHTIKVMSYNIQHGRGIDNDTVDLERIANVIRNSGADVVGLQEVDRFWSDRSDYQDQIKILAELLHDDGFEFYEYGANLDREPHEGYEERQYGTAVLSKYPIKEVENVLIDSYGKEQRGVLTATLDINGVDMKIYNTHLALLIEDRLGQVEEIVELMQGFSGPKMLIGDLNTLSDFEDFNYLLETGQLTDTFAEIEGAFTYPADGEEPTKRIDFILTSPLITFDNQKVIETQASDHLPIILDATISEEGMIRITVEDEDDPEAKLENVIYELRDVNDNIVVSDITTDQNGQAVIKNLHPGNYKLIEIDSVDNDYDLNAEPVPVTLDKGEIKEIVVKKQLTRGSIEIVSVDEDNEEIRLTDGVFELQDDEGQTIESVLKPNDSGKLLIDDLKPGNYQLVQVEAPLNYDINNEPVKFIIDRGQSEPLSIIFANEITGRKAELIMIDSETNQPIIDGEFSLIDDNGDVLKANLTVASSGKLTVYDLKPGNYQLIATKVPEGYEEISDPIEFTIEYYAEDEVVNMISLQPVSDEPGDPDNSELDAEKLKNEVDKIIEEELVEKDYTADSWTAFISALEESQTLIEHLETTQDDIDQTLSHLKTTRENLVLADEEDDAGNEDNKDSQNVDKNDNGQTANSNVGNKGSNASNNSSADINNNEAGEELPKTATSMFTMIMGGFIILLIAGILLIMEHRKKKIN